MEEADKSYNDFFKKLTCVDDNDTNIDEAMVALLPQSIDAAYFYFKSPVKINRVDMCIDRNGFHYVNFIPIISCDVVSNICTNDNNVKVFVEINHIFYFVNTNKNVNICHLNKYGGQIIFKFMDKQKPYPFNFSYTGLIFDTLPRQQFIDDFDEIIFLEN